MAKTVEDRLRDLRARRQGLSSTSNSATASLSIPLDEAFEKRSSKKAVQYTLGALQEVDPTYTANSISEGERVRNQLERGLQGEIDVAFDYQGSVPLNIHIKGVSDVDLLLLRTDFITVDVSGEKARAGGYDDWRGEPPSKLLLQMRVRAEQLLRSAFPEATVDVSGSKSICLSGGSLRRKVDVVPSHWHDTATYQSTRSKTDRGVSILLKDVPSTMKNLPFKHIDEVHRKDLLCQGGAKKVIRLLKNLRADSDYATIIELNSYEIAGLVWHFESAPLTVATWNELALLWTTKAQLDFYVANKSRTMSLKTPDGSRSIIESDQKFSSLTLLSMEVDQLVERVSEELVGRKVPTNEALAKSLREAYIP